jgi:hypothetical protein
LSETHKLDVVLHPTRIGENTVFEPYKQTIKTAPTAPRSLSTGIDDDIDVGPTTKRVITTELALPMIVYVLCQTGVWVPPCPLVFVYLDASRNERKRWNKG